MIGAGCDLHTEVERKTRFLMAGIVPGRTAGESVGVRLAMFSPLPAGARVSVTHDNGAGFARHTRLRDGLGMDTYFADPYSSRRRGSNENRNGMIRRYLPKRSEIQMGMAGELREIVDEADNRPMRVLDYRTPAEAFADELLELQDQQGCCTSKWTLGSVIPEPCATPAGTRDGRMAAYGGIRGPKGSGRLRGLRGMGRRVPHRLPRLASTGVFGFRADCRIPWNHSEGKVQEEEAWRRSQENRRTA